MLEHGAIIKNLIRQVSDWYILIAAGMINLPTCKRCGQKISFFSNSLICKKCEIDERYPDSKMVKHQKTCFYCGYITKTSVLQSSYENQNITNLGFGYMKGTGTVEHQYANKWTCSKFNFEITNNTDYRADNCTSYITREDYEKKCLSGEMNKDKEKSNIQIILDFSSLKNAMVEGGLVMTTYKCPNCNGMVKLPEAGKVLVCEYCGTPIKPVDIFEKIKSLIQ